LKYSFKYVWFAKTIYTRAGIDCKKGDSMKISATGWIIVLVFAAVLGVGLLGNQGGLTGQVSGSNIPITNGTILSVVAALLAIGVLIVAGLQQPKR
jgi:hypothetical protein